MTSLDLPLVFALVMLCAGLAYLVLGHREAAIESRVRQRIRSESRVPTLGDAGISDLSSRILETVGRWALRNQKSYDEWRAMAAAAGFWETNAAYRLAGLRYLLLLVVSGAGIVVLAVSGTDRDGIGIALMLVGCVTFAAVKPVLEWRRRARLERVARELPFFVDSMLLMLRSGANLDQSFRQVARTQPYAMPEIHAATAALVDQLEHGVSYQTALERWSLRLGSELTSELSSTFVQSLVMGTEISRMLRSFGQLFIERRLLQARERAGKRLVQLTVVMLLLFLPPLLMLLGAPAIDGLIAAFEAV